MNERDVRERETERENVFVCVCVCERRRWQERASVCVCLTKNEDVIKGCCHWCARPDKKSLQCENEPIRSCLQSIPAKSFFLNSFWKTLETKMPLFVHKTCFLILN